MGLEGIGGIEEIKTIRNSLREITEAREINLKEASQSITKIKAEYNALLKEKGIPYCAENCPELPVIIDRIEKELRVYGFGV